MIRWPVVLAQSTIFFRSLNSPIPKPSSLRSENTGIATPVAFHEGIVRIKCSSVATVNAFLSAFSIILFGPPPHASTSSVLESTNRYLYSSGNFILVTSRAMLQVGNNDSSSFIFLFTFQLPNESWLPITAKCLSGSICGQLSRRIRFFGISEDSGSTGFLLKKQSVNAVERKGLSP